MVIYQAVRYHRDTKDSQEVFASVGAVIHPSPRPILCLALNFTAENTASRDHWVVSRSAIRKYSLTCSILKSYAEARGLLLCEELIVSAVRLGVSLVTVPLADVTRTPSPRVCLDLLHQRCHDRKFRPRPVSGIVVPSELQYNLQSGRDNFPI